jgi:hypothetical protein
MSAHSPIKLKTKTVLRPHKQVMHVQSLAKRVISMKINAATTCSVCFEEKGRGEVGKGGVGLEPFTMHAT